MNPHAPSLAQSQVLDRWHASWIWSGPETEARNAYSFFRKPFTLAKAAALRLRLTADSFYWLWVDGEFRGRGPARAHLDWYLVDEYSLELGAGTHVLAVLVHHVGEVNATMMKGRPGLLAELGPTPDDTTPVIATDSSWRCLPATAWKRDLHCLMSHFGFWEECDRRQLPTHWTALAADDKDWTPAVVIGTPPCAPWTRLLGRDIPLPAYTPLPCRGLVATGGWRPGTPDPQGILAKTVAARTRTQGDMPADDGRWVTADFGRTVSGFVEFEVSGARGGECVELSYDEILTELGAVNPARSYAHLADRFLLAAGTNHIRTTHPRGFRYVMFDLPPAVAERAELTLERVQAVEETYPFTLAGSFRGDAQLESFYHRAAETVRICTTDAFTDCPTRERVQWMEDLYMHSLTVMVACGDTAMVRHALFQAAQCALPDGRINGFFPSERSNCAFAASSILWLALLAEYGWFSGATEDLECLAPTTAKLLRFIESQCDTDGLLAQWPAGQFWDWAPIEGSGCLLITNAAYAHALERLATLPTLATCFPGELPARLAQLRAAAHRRFWNVSRSLYADLRQADGAFGTICSQDANVMAVIGGVCPPALRRPLLLRLIDPQQLGPVPIGEQSLRDEMRPQLTHVVPCGTLWFGHWLCRALFENGLDDEALAQMRQLWGAYDDLPTFPETRIRHGNTGHCHGWASGPAYLLPTYVLGLRPEEPGWSRVAAYPHAGTLAAASGRVPTPRGPVTVSWEQRHGQVTPRIQTPAGVAVGHA